MIQEGMANARALVEAKSDPGANELVRGVAEEFQSSEGRGMAQETLKKALTGKSPAKLKAQVLEHLAKTSRLLEAKAPGDAAGYKAWPEGITQKVSEAASEGGFLGLGGVKVSDTEKASIAEVAQALRRA
jgi:hypothetical protein